MSKGGYYKKNTGKKTAVIVICVILALILGVVAFVGIYVNNMLGDINHVEVPEIQETEPVEQTEADAQTGETEATEATEATEPVEAFKSENYTNYLIVCKPAYKAGSVKVTDTMILCSLNTTTKSMTMTSLSADAMVEVPAYKSYAGGEAALNTVYGLGSTYGGTTGSMELMNQTLYNNYGIKVEKNFELDLKVLARVVTRLESVQINLSEGEAKYLSEATGKEIQAGQQEMDGNLALEYIQMWGDETADDISTINGQKKLFEGIVQKVRSQYVGDLEQIVKEMMPSITTSMSFTEFRDFLISLLPMVKDLTIESGGVYPK